MANQDMNEKILNKKFKKAVFSGYDMADVDAFFDLVIEYLKNNDKMVELYKGDNAQLKKQILELQAKLDELLKQNKKLAAEVKTYEGYGKNWLKPNQKKQGE